METYYDEGELFWQIEATIAKNRGTSSTPEADHAREVAKAERGELSRLTAEEQFDEQLRHGEDPLAELPVGFPTFHDRYGRCS